MELFIKVIFSGKMSNKEVHLKVIKESQNTCHLAVLTRTSESCSRKTTESSYHWYKVVHNMDTQAPEGGYD